MANLQVLCRSCNRAKHNDRKRGFSRTLDARGFPLDPQHPAQPAPRRPRELPLMANIEARGWVFRADLFRRDQLGAAYATAVPVLGRSPAADVDDGSREPGGSRADTTC